MFYSIFQQKGIDKNNQLCVANINKTKKITQSSSHGLPPKTSLSSFLFFPALRSGRNVLMFCFFCFTFRFSLTFTLSLVLDPTTIFFTPSTNPSTSSRSSSSLRGNQDKIIALLVFHSNKIGKEPTVRLRSSEGESANRPKVLSQHFCIIKSINEHEKICLYTNEEGRL